MENGKKFDWPHLGNKHVKEFLEKSITSGEIISNTYIFNGPDNLGKTTTAYYFAKSLLCEKNSLKNFFGPCEACPACRKIKTGREKGQEGLSHAVFQHSDFYYIKPEADKKNISIEQVRGFINSLSMTSFLGSYKVGIIKHADLLSQEAANALLKTLEEPKKGVVIILITEDFNRMPNTIVSRSQVMEFRPVATEEIYDFLIKDLKASRSQAKNFSRLSLGRPALAVKFLQNKEFYESYSAKAKVFLDFFRQDINQRFISLSALLGSSQKGPEGARQAIRVLQVWQGVLRDFMLVNLNLGNLVQHEIKFDDLDTLKAKVPLEKAAQFYRVLEEAETDLASNVNPSLVLENVAVRI